MAFPKFGELENMMLFTEVRNRECESGADTKVTGNHCDLEQSEREALTNELAHWQNYQSLIKKTKQFTCTRETSTSGTLNWECELI